jgi:hypothetical protein
MYHGAAVVARSASTAPIRCSPGSSPLPSEEELLLLSVVVAVWFLW